MNRKDVITLAEKTGLLYPEPMSSSDYGHPQHQRFISKLEKFAEAIENKVIQNQEDEVESAIRDLTNICKENQISCSKS